VSDHSIIGTLHFLVEASTSDIAIAKGSAAASLLEAGESEGHVDECRPIHDLRDEPAPQLVDPWPKLPEVASVSSEDGTRLLAAIRNRIAEGEEE